MNKITAIVPIKKDSERIPGKNFLPFCGKPLFHYMLSTLQQCEAIEKILINTDSEIIIQEISAAYSKAVIIPRPDFLLGHHIVANELIAYDISQTSDEHFLQTHITNPLLSLRSITNAVNLYFCSLQVYDSLFSVNCIRKRMYDADCRPLNHSNNDMKPTQQMDPVYVENSNLFIFSKSSFKNAGNSRIGLKPQLFEMNDVESIDIDYPEDFKLAEIIYQNKEKFNIE